MRLFSYVVARDYGFAPNPFFGFCTLATCKPMIRKTAQVGDWVIGTGSKTCGLAGFLVYAMRVSETCTYDQYWGDPRFQKKQPNLRGSLKQAYGDNIYHHDPRTHRWLQENSHHSLPDGRANCENVEHDTQYPRVLVGTEFVYWGGDGPRIPARFRRSGGRDVCCSLQGHKCKFPSDLVESFVEWIQSLGVSGCIGKPKQFED
jgi:hypothetical protein